jgi:hypothetical protein
MYSYLIMSYRSLGTKAYNIERSIGSKAFSLASIGSKINPLSLVGNTLKNKALEIGAHKLMDQFAPVNRKIK